MELIKHHGMSVIVEGKYRGDDSEPTRLIGESSAVGEYPDALNKPGSSFLWVGEHHHLSREQVAKLVGMMRCWLASGHLDAEAVVVEESLEDRVKQLEAQRDMLVRAIVHAPRYSEKAYFWQSAALWIEGQVALLSGAGKPVPDGWREAVDAIVDEGRK